MGKRRPSASTRSSSSDEGNGDAPTRDDAQITQMLRQWSDGDATIFDRLTERVYDQLRFLADQALVKDQANKSLQPTELVHEAYLRLVDAKQLNWKNRSHFFGIAARLMREILVDRARARGAEKRGGRVAKLSIQSMALDVADPHSQPIDLISLDLALEELTALDHDQGRLVELRFFAGMTVEETAEVLGVSVRTIKRDWRLAKAWLRRRLSISPA